MKSKINILLTTGAALFLFALSSCQNDEEHLHQKWQTVSFESEESDSMMKLQELYIDTLSMVPEDMAAYFQTSDLNEVKEILKQQVEDSKTMQEDQAKMLNMTFLKEGIVLMGNGGPEVDSAKYTLEDKTTLTLTPMTEEAGPAQSDKLVIDKISKNSLRLKIDQNQSSSYINLRPFTTEDSVTAAKLYEERSRMMEEQMMQMMQQQEGLQE